MKQDQQEHKQSRISSSTFLSKLRSKVVKVRETDTKAPFPLTDTRKSLSNLKNRPNLSTT